jgi:cytochrome c oxidase cbb3-type subunit 3
MRQEMDKLFDHDYDGIQEYDNPLPPWWVTLFYITIFWAVIYLLFYHVFEIGDRSVDEYQKEYNPRWTKELDPTYQPTSFLPTYRSPYLSGARDLTPRMQAELSGKTAVVKVEEPEIVFDFEPLTAGADLAAGKASYEKNCVVCHGANGEGGVGPNLTDNFFIHGAGFNDMMKTVTKGVPEKGMLAWGKLIKPDEIHLVTSYIFTFKGKNVAGGKAPQGTEVK